MALCGLLDGLQRALGDRSPYVPPTPDDFYAEKDGRPTMADLDEQNKARAKGARDTHEQVVNYIPLVEGPGADAQVC